MRMNAACVSLAAWALACSPATDERRPVVAPHELLQIWVQPADGSTAWDGPLALTVELAIPGGGLTTGDFDAAVIASALEPELSLVEWPSRVEVPASIQVEPPLVLSDDFASNLILTLAPAQELARDRGYAVLLRSLPRIPPPGMPGSYRLSADGGGGLAALPGGSYVARFRRGSAPSMAGVTICPVDPGLSDVAVRFSETVYTVGAIQDAIEVHVGSSRLDCVGGHAVPSTDPALRISLECPELPESASIRVVLLGDQVRALSDTAAPPQTWDLVLADMQDDGDGCRYDGLL